MLKNLLMAIGLRKAPAPVKSYVAASTFVGVVPAIAYVAWKYRDRILPVVKSLRDGRIPTAASAVAPVSTYAE